MTRQLISTNKQTLLRSSHAKRPPQSGFVQVGKSETLGTWVNFRCPRSPARLKQTTNRIEPRCPHWAVLSPQQLYLPSPK